jgi:hypothetical protein
VIRVVIRRLLALLDSLIVRTPRAPRPAATARSAPPDPPPAAVYAMQKVMPSWLVTWSRWRRSWAAFALVPADPPIVDDADTVRLLERCRAAELAAAGRPAVAT